MVLIEKEGKFDLKLLLEIIWRVNIPIEVPINKWHRSSSVKIKFRVFARKINKLVAKPDETAPKLPLENVNSWVNWASSCSVKAWLLLISLHLSKKLSYQKSTNTFLFVTSSILLVFGKVDGPLNWQPARKGNANRVLLNHFKVMVDQLFIVNFCVFLEQGNTVR